MLQIGDVILSLDIVEKKFLCDIGKCKGACCEHGDAGAPLEAEEEAILEEIYPQVKPFLREEGILAIEEQGFAVLDIEADLVTPLRDGKECAFTIYEGGIAQCGIEKAYEAGLIDFKKPISCELYPIRAKKYSSFEGLNYDQWDLCKVAEVLGEKKGLPVYKFLKNPLIRKYGETWYEELEKTAKIYLTTEKQDPITINKKSSRWK